jgi:hypothetical protein
MFKKREGLVRGRNEGPVQRVTAQAAAVNECSEVAVKTTREGYWDGGVVQQNPVDARSVNEGVSLQQRILGSESRGRKREKDRGTKR